MADTSHTVPVNPKHDFTARLRQPSLLPRVKEYVEWQRRVRRARALGEDPPAPPDRLAPISINLDLTTACSYRCDHCIDREILNSKVRYEHADLMASLDNMIGLGLRSVILIGGGEPVLYPQFVEVVRFLKERNVQVAIVSGGSHNERIWGIVDCLGEGDWVRLSLDAGTNETFVRMHRPARKGLTLEEICGWVSRMRERNPALQIGFSFIVTWENAMSGTGAGIVPNIGEMVAAARLARDHGFSYISFKPFLTRYPDGAEVMDPAVIADFDRTVERIRESIARARVHETETFRVVESINLKVLMDKTWRDLTHQPSTCHMQAFHQVLSPIGLYSCPGYRGVEKAHVAGRNAYVGAEIRNTQRAVAGLLERLDAAHECANVTCLFNSVNWWLERLVNGELDPRDIETVEEIFGYYF